VLHQHWGRVQVVHRDVEEPLQLVLVEVDGRGWSLRSWRAYPKYGTTAVIRAALARLAASMRRSSSRMFSAGGPVGWTMNTSCPRTFSSILTKISPSANRLIVTQQSGRCNGLAIASASGRFAVPDMSSILLLRSEISAMGTK
jgi:hypothetical protein